MDFADDYLATSLLAKWPGFVHADLDPVSACKKADELAEHHCGLSNRRLRNALAAPNQENSAYLHLISQMQADIARVLGGFDPVRWQESCRFGPGKAQGQKGRCDYEKLVATPSCTAGFLTEGSALIAECSPWLEALSGIAPDPEEQAYADLTGEELHVFDVVIEPGDVNIMVPKNAKTKRGIRSQPGLNVYAQLGIGVMIRQQLKAAGLDLDDQGPNQLLAKLGSKNNRSVTIDLKGASGHICRVLPDILLLDDSPRWLYAMNLCRTRQMIPHGENPKDGNWVPLRSFSAMGNGFTFELESLIFWAATRACRRAVGDTLQYRVYGDDIICSRETADLLIPFLNFLGFPLNAKKTFIEGPFRESCGADFWRGTNVRPIFFSATEEELQEGNSSGTSILRWLQTCNAIRRLARRRNHDFGCDQRLLAAWRTAILRIPKHLRECLKSPWDAVRDDSLITHDDDALCNPLINRCGTLQAIVSPRLSISCEQLTPRSFLGAKATVLYRALQSDRLAVRYDRTRSWLQRVLQTPPKPRTTMQEKIDRVCNVRNSASDTSILPNLHNLKLGAGWEVFQSVGEDATWRLIG